MAKKKLKLDGTLKGLIEEFYADERSEPYLVPGAGLRASGLADLCPREETLRAVYRLPKRKKIDAGLNLIFTHGTALHEALQNKVLPSIPGCFYGIWKCNVCRAPHGGADEGQPFSPDDLIVRPEVCDCGASDFEHVESHFWSPELRIGGHPDGFIKLESREGFGVFEAKTISSQRFWKVKNLPDMSHVIQTHIYMMFTGFQWALIFYWDKGGFGTNAFVEHIVERDEDTIEQIKLTLKSIWGTLDPYWEVCRANWEAGLPAPLIADFPPRVCEKKDCPRSEECGIADLCFAGVNE